MILRLLGPAQAMFVAAIFVAARASAAAPIKSIALNYRAHTSALNFAYGADGNHGVQCETGVSVATDLASFGATLIRTHDADAIDWTIYFPHPKLDVRTDDPANYNWTVADAYFRGIVDAGFEPYLRLGTSWGTGPGGGLPPAGTPYNRSALVDILLHTVMHFNDGWGGGGFVQKSVRYWEIWNGVAFCRARCCVAGPFTHPNPQPLPSAAEPDDTCSFRKDAPPPACGRFWNRTAADFYDLADDAARAIKAYDAALIVGTTGVANVWWPAHNPFGFPLIAELGRRGTPIDFFSWHGYISDVSWYARTAAAVRAALDAAYPQRRVEMHVTEFFPCVLCDEQDSAYGAAVMASTLATFASAGVTVASAYPLCTSGAGRTAKGWGLFDEVSVPGAAAWRPLTHAFALFGELASTAPQLLGPISVSPAEPSNYTVLAGRDARGSVLKMLLGVQQSTTTSVAVEVRGLGGGDGRPWSWDAVALNNSLHSPALVAGGVARPDATDVLRLAFPLAPPAVVLLRVQRV